MKNEFLKIKFSSIHKTCNVILPFIFLFTSSILLSQTNYYVAKNGSNSNSGTSISSPFLTISHAVSQINPGDKIYIRRGTYHEGITIDNIDSTNGNETLISNYNNEQVIIDGTIAVNGSWIDDTIGGVAVKKIENFTESISQLFVGNDQMVMARWPNAQFNDLTIYDHDNWAHGEETGSTDGSFLIDETHDNPGSLSLANSIGILNVGSFRTFNREIATHTQQGGDDIITYTTPIGENGLGAGLSNNGELKDKHHYFFFERKKEFIDAENEWFLDTTTDELYLNPPNGVELFQTPVRGKVRDYSITITGSEYLKINGLTFFATTIHASGSKNLEISECNFYYPSHSKRMLGDLSGANATTFGTGSGNTARVDSSTVSGCLFIDTEGEALIIRGNNNTIKNSYFRNIDWSATELNGLMVSVFIDGTGNTFTGNEIYHTGASATVWPGEQSIFSYNIVSSTGHAQSDGSVFQGTKNYVFGSEVHHNFVYDTEKYAFRYDAPGGDAAQAGSFGVMHHNIADNTLGLMIKGNNQIIAHNTVINTINNRNDIIILAEDCSNTNTWLYNNLAERIGSHRSDVLFSAPSNGPMPIGTEGYIENGDDWEVCDSNDGALYSGTGTGSSTGNMDSINVSRPGIGYNSNIENLIDYNPGNGKTISDYQPISNQIIDQGVSLTNTVSTSLTASNQLNSIVPHTPVGSGTDIGAIDGNSLWTPGVQGWTPQQNINLEDIFYNPGIVKSNLLLHFDFANSTSYPGSGNQVYDLSNNYNQGELNGNPSMINNHGGEIDLDGTNDYIQLNDPFSYQEHSVEMWIKMKDSNNAFLWDARDANDDGYIFWYLNGFRYFIRTNDLNNSQSYNNQWVQVVACYNGEKSRIFINGQKVEQSNTLTNNSVINNNTNVRIGVRSFDPVASPSKAEIGIVRFYNQTLYSADVLQNYNANAPRYGLTSNPASPTSIDITQPIPTRGLKLYLDSTKSDSYQSGGNTWFDLSGNDYDFTVVGNPPFDSSIKGGIIDFQAGGDYATNNSDPILNVNSYTKFAVFNPIAATTNNIISGGNDSKHAFFMAGANNQFRAGHNSDWDQVIDQPNGGASILNIWNLGTVTFDTDSGFDLYYGGNLVDSNSSATAAVNQTSPRVNIARYNTGNYFTGYIPVAIIYDRKLSNHEVNSLSNHFASRYGLSHSNTSSLTIDEGVPINTILADLDVTDPDSTQFIYELVSGNGGIDQHNSSFTISGTQIVVGQIISFDNTPLMNINLKVTDESNNSLTQSLIIYVNDLNRAPTDIGISSTTFLESVSASSTIATLSAVDSDTSDTHVFTLINGDGSNDADNSSFTISGTNLIINSSADYETKTSYNLYINVNDGVNDFAKAFTVSVTNVNDEPPSDIFFLDVDTNNLVLYLNAKNSDSYPTSGNKWFDLSGNYNHGLINGATYNSSADGGFSFDGSNDKIVIQHDSSLNFENDLTLIYTLKPDWSNSSYSPGFSKGENKNSNFSTWIGSDKQIDISTQVGNNQTENVNSLRPAYDATNDISAGNWYTIAITIDSSNNQKTYINGSQVGATKSITLGATNSLNLTIGELPGYSHSTYGGGEIGKVILYNSALTSAQVSSNFNLMSNSSTPTSTYASINEGSPLNSLVGSFTATDSDTSIFTFSIVQGNGNNDQHNSYFTISGNQLLVNNGNINYDLTPKLFVNIQVSDGLQNYTKPFEIIVKDLNRAPTDIGISSTTFSESVSASSTIATLSAVDSDTSDTHVFTLINGDGSNDADNSSFTISGTSLIINSTADYETKTSYNIYINVNDGVNDFAKAFTVSVTNINEAPSDLGFLTIPTNGLILHLDASNSNSYPGNGNTWFDLSGQNAHAEATTLPPFGLNGAQIKNFDFNENGHGFNSVNLNQEYRDLLVIKKYEVGGGGIKTVFGHYDHQDNSFRIHGNQVRVVNNFNHDDWQNGSQSDVFINGSFITQDTNVLDRWVFVRTYRSNNSGFGNSFRYEISKGHGGGSRSYRGKINLILAYNRKLTNQEVQDIYQSLSPRLSGNQTSFTVSSTSSQTSIDEEVSIGTVVGTLTAIDSDTTNLTFSLVSGNGTNDQHNSLFTVSGTLLIVAGNIDYETNSTLNILVQVSDGQNTYQKAMIVNVNDVKETPLIQVSDIVKTFGGANFDLTATSSSTGAFTYTIADQSLASVNGNTITILGAGSTSITVTQAEDNNFTSATATFSLTINKADVIIMINDITKNYGDNDFNLTAVSSSTFVLTSDFITLSPPTNTNPTYWYVSSVWNDNSFYENAPPGYANNKYYTPWLDSPQSWSAKFNNTSQWITLDLQGESMVYQVITKARTISNNNYNQYVKKANILYGIDNTNWTTIFNNTSLQSASNDIPVSKVLAAPVPARYVKVEPTEWNNHISMRMGVVYRTISQSLVSDGSLTFSSSNNNVVSTSSSSATINGAGSVNITVSQAETSNYNSSTSSFTINVNKIDPTITFDNLTKTYGDADFNLAATSSSTGAFTFNILDANVATVTGSNTNIVGAGTTTVTVTQAADSNYNAATATMTLTVNKADNTITFDDLTKIYEDPNFNLVATSSSTGAFTFNILDANVATVVGSSTTIVGAGTTTVTVTQAADSNYNTATATMTLTVNKADPSIIFNDVIATYGEVDFDLTSTSSSTGALTYNILDVNVASLSDKTVTIEGAGSTTVTLNQAADSNYNAATATMTLTVNKVYPLITFDDITKIYGDADFFLTATSSSTGAFTYNIIDANVATVTGSTTTIVGAGSTLVTVSQAENSNYNAANATMTLTVNESDPTITFNNVNKTFTDPDFNITATSSSSGVFTYNILDNNIATVSGNTVTIIGAGTTSVTVTQSADSNYNAATATMTLTVNKADPGIGNFNNINKTYGDSDFEIIEPSKNNLNNSNFIYSSSDSNIASISGNTISIKRAGSVVINASLPSDNNFNASVVSATLNINKASQSISIGSLPTTLPLKDFNSISLTASSTSGTPVSIILANGSAASLNGGPGNYNLESIQQTGLVTITYYVDENSSVNYSAATVTLVVDVVKVNQNISFNSSPTSNFEYSENLSIPIDASASSSLTLSYNLISGNASLNSNIISVNGTGQIIVELSQIGNNEFNAAPPLNYSVNIGQGTTLLSGFSVPSKYEDDIPFQVTPPTSNRLGEIVYSSSNLQIATISGTVIRILNDGQTIITANQIANNNYRSGTISTVFIVNEAIIPDSDNDGVDDENDNCITNFNPLQEDYDNDNIGNICDNDDDNDGYLDSNDEFPLNPNEWSDYDKDGLGDNQDNDDDNDNWPDSIEISCNTNPLDNSSYPGDYDGDLIPNCEDQDDDNDGYLDDQDEFPENELEWKDNDQDGIGDNEDQDDDQDGYTDNDESSCNSDPLDPDSTPDDFDQDFIPNCTDLDDDNDGCLDNEDTFPLDYYECLDSDNDGIGDNADNDDDNDGVSDSQDAFPFDPTEQKDTDGDGIGDNSDTDYNSDGLPDDVVFPSQFFSPNGDGINDSWKVVNTNLFPNCEVWIYTRSGELIYNKKGYTNDWTGLLNGEPLPEASYVYMVDPDGDGTIDLKGWIYLTR